MTVILLESPPKTTVRKRRANLGDRDLYDAVCNHGCGTIGTFDPNGWLGRAMSPALRAFAARTAAHAAARAHTCPEGGTQ